MAQAVENASVVVPVLTEKYKHSNPSRQGMKYAHIDCFMIEFEFELRFIIKPHLASLGIIIEASNCNYRQ